jgi:voltage-gated potassium channel
LSQIPKNETETSPASRPAEGRPLRIGSFRFSAAQFLAALILMLVAAPLLDDLKHGELVEVALLTLVLVTGVLAVGRTHRTLVLAVVLALPAVLARWISHFRPDWAPAEFHTITALVFIGFVEFQLLHFIFRARRVNSDVLCAGISGYLLLGIVFMLAFRLVSLLSPFPGDAAHPAAFAFTVGAAPAGALPIFDAYYFSYITLSTVGYGDITPLTNGARTLAMTEAMTGTIYMAVLISRLVSLYSSEKQNAGANGPTGGS